MGTILQTSDYGSIRVKLGVTTDDLPDADIDTIGLLPVAEAMIESLVTDYAAILAAGGANKIFLQNATLCLVGGLACDVKLAVQRGQSFRSGEYSESETKVDWAQKRDTLMMESRSSILRISTHTAPGRQTLFAATGPTSSGAVWPTMVDQWFARLKPQVLTWLRDNGYPLYSWEIMP